MDPQNPLTQPVMFYLLHEEHGHVPLQGSLNWDPRDPATVLVNFETGDEGGVDWMMGRSLLAKGLSGRAGMGDVVVSAENGVLRLDLSSPFGVANFECDATAVAGFLSETFGVLPRAAEPPVIDAAMTTEGITPRGIAHDPMEAWTAAPHDAGEIDASTLWTSADAKLARGLGVSVVTGSGDAGEPGSATDIGISTVARAFIAPGSGHAEALVSTLRRSSTNPDVIDIVVTGGMDGKVSYSVPRQDLGHALKRQVSSTDLASRTPIHMRRSSLAHEGEMIETVAIEPRSRGGAGPRTAISVPVQDISDFLIACAPPPNGPAPPRGPGAGGLV